MTSWLANPWLLAAGLAAVSLPIAIHLFNRRRFRVVEWAAMDLLLAAEKQNRRRIRLENLSLLLLRCLAVFLLGMLVARPFVPSRLTAGLIEATRYERIVLLDDSLSMQARLGTGTALDRARGQLADLCTKLAREKTDNTLTVVLTSRPEQPLLKSIPLAESSLAEILRTIDNLMASDGTAHLEAALTEIEAALANRPEDTHRLLYVLSDLRQSDWTDATVKRLLQLAEKLQGATVIDCADDDDRNLTIEGLTADGVPIAGLPLSFDVTVRNHGRSGVENVRVQLTADASLPLEAAMERIGGGEAATVRMSLPLAAAPSEIEREPPGQRITARLKTAQEGADDRLEADSTALFAARVSRGIRTLLVDGDPRAEFGKSESFYLTRALAPIGPVQSGVVVETVAEDAWESMDLDDFQVVFWLNPSGFMLRSGAGLARLEQWVARGGGLVLMPGDRVDARIFNSQLERGGAGLSPLRLVSIAGNDQPTTWFQLQPGEPRDELLREFGGPNDPLLAGVKIFRFWQSELSGDANVLATLTDLRRSTAIATKRFGEGKTIAFNIPADADWHNWPAEPSYLLLMQDLVKRLVSQRAGGGPLTVGQPIRESIDLTKYEGQARLTGPRELAKAVEAKPSETDSKSPTRWLIEHDRADFQGFYELQLKLREGGDESRLVAVNVDPSEGNLQRVRRDDLTGDLAAKSVVLLNAADVSLAGQSSGASELWRYLLVVVVAVLFSEQLLGWYLGRRRS